MFCVRATLPTMFKNYLYLFQTIFSRHKFRIVLLTLFGFINGALDSISIGTLIPLFSFIVKDANASTSFISRSVAWLFGVFHIPFTIWMLLVFMVLLFVTKAVGEFLTIYVRVRITTDYENDTRDELYEKTLRARWPYLLNQKMGYLENVLMTDVRITQGLLKQICASAPNLASFIVYLSVAIGISRSVTLVTIIFGVVILILSYPLVRLTKRYAGEQTAISKLIAHRVNESVSGMKTIKAMGVVDQVVLRERNVFEKLKQLIVKSSLILQLGTSPTESLGHLFIIGLFAFSYTQPGFSFASFAVVMYLVQRLFLSVR
ncbi:MAG: ABC transporter transmembrane domain-containing protein, partial [Candidatus Sungbacteria bacterium]|nr:ABC transporter transmembrane domain-containing protein [Candidatus Sungbacteria bacterium]